MERRVVITACSAITPIGHGKKEIDYKLMEADKRESNKSEILDYLKEDCVSLWHWVDNFVRQFGNHFTLATAAFNQLRKTGYDVKRTYETFDDRFRPFYYGGRVQCFEVGSWFEPFKLLDINKKMNLA